MSDSDGDLVAQDRVLVEADLGGRGVGFRAVVAKVCFSELWLGLQSSDRRIDMLESRQPLRLTIARPGAALLGESMFLRHLGSSRSRLFAIVRPLAYQTVQRRAHVRAALERPVLVRELDRATGEPQGRGAGGKTVNVGPGGMLFETDLAVGLGDHIELILTLTPIDRLTIRARVTRVGEPAGSAQPVPAGIEGSTRIAVAATFLRISAYDQDRITRHIYADERRRREAPVKRA